MLELLSTISDPEEQQRLSHFYEKYYDILYARAYHILRHREDSQDCVQDVMEVIVELYDAKFSDREDADILRFASICCRNRAINMCKQRNQTIRNTVQLESRLDDSLYSDISDDEVSVQDLLINAETCEIVRKLVKGLKLEYRDVIVLKYYYDMSNIKIAESLGISESLVGTRLHRAKKMLLKEGKEKLDALR